MPKRRLRFENLRSFEPLEPRLLMHGGDAGEIGHAHPDDPEKQAEHEAVLRLVPITSATHTALVDGMWSNPLTWGGSVPTAASKVVIPVGRTVTVDNGAADWIRVDGRLNFVVVGDTNLVVETIVVAPGGIFENLSTGHSRIIFRDDGPIDTVADPFMLSRGLISHGVTRIAGVWKQAWTTHEPVLAGATTLVVPNHAGWQIGDKLLLAQDGVEFKNYTWSVVNRDDAVRVDAILPGGVVRLNRPLTFSHAAVSDGLTVKAPIVVNLTRNIVFESQNPAVDRRGHVMLMHSDTHSVANAEFLNLGRTDKSKQVTDPNGLGGGVANVRGRYSLHFHRTGINGTPATANGVVINGVVGWGLVNHDSNVNVDWAVGANGFGSLFVTELGNERGHFKNTAAVRVTGVGRIDDTRLANDAGHTGDGFWIEGAHVLVENCYASAAKSSGFTFFSMAGAGINFRNNTTLNSLYSLTVWDVGGNGIGFPPFTPNNLVEGNFLHGGVGQGYSSRITYRNNSVVGLHPNISTHGFSHTGVNTHIHLLGNRVVDFQNGIVMPTEGDSVLEGGFYDNLNTNLLIQNTQQLNQRTIAMRNPSFGTRATWNIDMSVSFFSYSLVGAYPLNPYAAAPDWRPLFANHNSAIGHPNSLVTLDGVKLYFEEQGAAFEFGKRLTRFPNELRFETNGSFSTTASLAARGLIVGGQPLPAGEQFYLNKIRGVLVRDNVPPPRSQESILDEQLNLVGPASHFNWGGKQEKWIRSGTTVAWYYILPDGKLYRWHGGAILTGDTLVAQLSTATYQNPALLFDAF